MISQFNGIVCLFSNELLLHGEGITAVDGVWGNRQEYKKSNVLP